MRKKDLAVFTVCNIAYLNKTMVLADSVYQHQGIKTNIFIIDGKRDIDWGKENFCTLHWIEDYNVPDFESLAFKYDIIELSTCLKPFIAKYLLQDYEKVIFFDPDVMTFSSLTPIEKELDCHPVVLTPHYFTPKKNGDINDWRLMKFGYHNLGFFAVRNDDKALNFLEWWSDRCFTDCYNDPQFGIFTDQKWINLAIGFFPFVYTSLNPGYNVAFWNIDQRKIEFINGKYIVDGVPLVFMHFSAFNMEKPQQLSRRSFELGENSKAIIEKLAKEYKDAIDENDKSVRIADKSYSYDFMTDGTYVTPLLRRAYGAKIEMLKSALSPFDINGEVAEFGRKNGLIRKNTKKYVAKGYNDLVKKDVQRKMNLLFRIMRIVLRFIGPNNYMNLSRLMVYLSGYNRLPQMWK